MGGAAGAPRRPRALATGRPRDSWHYGCVPAAPVSAPVQTEQPVGDVVPDRPWVTIVWNDPVNLMTYVTYVFMTYFTYSRKEAERLMLAVHHEGRAVVSNGSREEMEVDAAAMHSYGLWATVQKDD